MCDSGRHFSFLSLPRAFQSFLFLSPLSTFHGSKSPECNRNKALSGLIRLFRSFRPFLPSPPPSPIDCITFGCLVAPPCYIVWLYEWAPFKVIWSLCLSRALHTQLAHTSFISCHEMENKKLKLVDWLTPPPPPPHSLGSNPHGDGSERKRSKVSRRDCRRKGERGRDKDKRKSLKSPDVC